MTIANIIDVLGGLGFFLFGMSLLGDGLKRVAGSKLETVLGKLTSTTFKGVLLGALVTAVIQSSSATTVMVVGFVNSGIMKLSNAMARFKPGTAYQAMQCYTALCNGFATFVLLAYYF